MAAAVRGLKIILKGALAESAVDGRVATKDAHPFLTVGTMVRAVVGPIHNKTEGFHKGLSNTARKGLWVEGAQELCGALDQT